MLISGPGREKGGGVNPAWGGWGRAAEGGPLPSPCPPFVPSYEVQLGDSLVSMSGCSLECWKDVVQKACCPGYWGSQCYGTGEGGVPALFLTPQPYSWPPVCSLCLHTPSTCSFDEHPEPTQLGRLALAAPEEGLSLGLPELLGSG